MPLVKASIFIRFRPRVLVFLFSIFFCWMRHLVMDGSPSLRLGNIAGLLLLCLLANAMAEYRPLAPAAVPLSGVTFSFDEGCLVEGQKQNCTPASGVTSLGDSSGTTLWRSSSASESQPVANLTIDLPQVSLSRAGRKFLLGSCRKMLKEERPGYDVSYRWLTGVECSHVARSHVRPLRSLHIILLCGVD